MLKRPCILIVEDDMDLANRLTGFFHEKHCLVKTFASAQDAIRFINSTENLSFTGGVFDCHVTDGATEELTRLFRQNFPHAITIGIPDCNEGHKNMKALVSVVFQKPLIELENLFGRPKTTSAT